MQIQHELNQRPVHACQCSADDGETRPGNFCRRLEIEHAQTGAKIDMIPDLKRKFTGLAPATNFVVCRFVIAIGNAFVKQVRHPQHQFVQLVFDGLHFGFGLVEFVP